MPDALIESLNRSVEGGIFHSLPFLAGVETRSLGGGGVGESRGGFSPLEGSKTTLRRREQLVPVTYYRR